VIRVLRAGRALMLSTGGVSVLSVHLRMRQSAVLFQSFLCVCRFFAKAACQSPPPSSLLAGVDGEWPGVFVWSRRQRSARGERFGAKPRVPTVFSRGHASQRWERVFGRGR